MKKRIISMLLPVCMVFGLLTPVISAETEYTDITSLSEITDMNGSYRLTQDAAADFVIGSISSKFTGRFDGGGHTITLNILNVESNYVGMFSYLGAEAVVSNFIISDSAVSAYQGYQYSGIVAGYNEGTISGVRIYNSTLSAYKDYGGIAGVNTGTISECSVDGGSIKLNQAPYSDNSYGGIAGENRGQIIKCSSSTTLINNMSKDNYGYFGGIAGKNTGSVSDCYNSGEISGSNKGYYVGGVVGYNTSGTVKNCYNSGNITLAGGSRNAVSNSGLTNCYYLDSCGASGGGSAKTEAEFASLASALGEDWEDGTDGFPVLSWETDKYSSTAVRYSIEYYTENLDGGYSLNITKTAKAEPGDVVTAAPEELSGFTYDPENPDSVLSGNASEELVLKLYYTRNSYELTFDAAGGTINDADYTHGAVKYGAPITAPSDLTRGHYTFSGWDKTVAAEMPAADTVYTAAWAAEAFAVTFDANGGSCSVTEWASESGSAMKVTYGQEYGQYRYSSTSSYWYSRSLPVPVLSGKTFAGWYTAADGGELVTASSIVTAEADHTLYAHWADAYTVTFDVNGGSLGYGYSSAIDVAQDTAYGDNKIPTATKTGHTFNGWFDADGNQLTKETVISSDITFTAVWTPYTYTVTFNANGGSGEMESQVFTYGIAQKLSKNLFTKEGYQFYGWSKSSYSSTVSYTDEQEVSDLTSSNNGTFPLYAVWGEIRHSLSFDITPADALIVVKDSTGAVQTPDSSGIYSLLEGSYSYVVSKYGYESAESTVNLFEDTVICESLTPLPFYKVIFDITAPDGSVPDITVLYNGAAIPPQEDASYSLVSGEYSYTIKASGYNKITGSFTVSDADIEITHTLQPRTSWDGETLTEPPSADGAYQISNGDQLAWLAAEVNKGGEAMAYNAVLTADIDLGDEPWTPIGNSYSIYFGGSFDGNGHKITGLYTNGSTYQGLFGYLKGGVSNLSIYGSVNATNYAGGIAGYAYGASISRCANYASINSAGSTGYIGGIAGRAYNTAINECFNAGSISGAGFTGGISGDAAYTSSISDCYNIGSVTGSKNNIGGITGYANYQLSSSDNTVINCYNAAPVTSTSTGSSVYTGGIIGNLSDYTTVTNCYYLEGTAEYAVNGYSVKNQDGLSSESEMQSAGFAAILGGAFIPSSGYPLLAWQQSFVLSITSNSVSAEGGVLSGALTVNAANNTDGSVPAAAVVAIYENGRMIYTALAEKVLETGGNEIIFDDISAQCGGEFTVKVFLWSGIDTEKPLAPAYTE